MISKFLLGKTAVITGSLSGIGLGIARSLSAAGSNIVLNGFASQQEIKKIENQLSNKDSKAHFIHADLTKPKDAEELVKQSIKHFGKVDILVNNAGMQHIDQVQNFPDEMWEKVIALNLSSAFYTTKHALPGMVQRKWGRIINIASVHGLVASVNKSAYVASKHGMVGFSKAVALQNAKNGVTCNTICPGFILTPLIQKQIEIKSQKNNTTIDEARRALIQEKQPSGDFSLPEDIGQLAAHLCKGYARQMTGSTYTVDGGWTAQ